MVFPYPFPFSCDVVWDGLACLQALNVVNLNLRCHNWLRWARSNSFCWTSRITWIQTVEEMQGSSNGLLEQGLLVLQYRACLRRVCIEYLTIRQGVLRWKLFHAHSLKFLSLYGDIILSIKIVYLSDWQCFSHEGTSIQPSLEAYRKLYPRMNERTSNCPAHWVSSVPPQILTPRMPQESLQGRECSLDLERERLGLRNRGRAQDRWRRITKLLATSAGRKACSCLERKDPRVVFSPEVWT